MPRLLLFRHAKAERDPPKGGSDHERVLSKRGRADAAAMGRLLAERGDVPARVLCSTSARTRETWDLAREAFADPPAPVFLRALFEAGGDYLDILRSEGGDADRLIVVGHNPTIQRTAIGLAESLDAPDGRLLAEDYPTSAVAVLDWTGAWRDLQPASMRLFAFLRPDRGSD